MAFTLSRRRQGRKTSYISKKIRYTTIKSHANSIKSNHLNTSNNDNVIGNSNLPYINVQTKRSFHILITFQKETDTESSVSVNDEITGGE